MLAIHNFSELKSLANDAKIRSSLKFPLMRYISDSVFFSTFISIDHNYLRHRVEFEFLNFPVSIDWFKVLRKLEVKYKLHLRVDPSFVLVDVTVNKNTEQLSMFSSSYNIQIKIIL